MIQFKKVAGFLFFVMSLGSFATFAQTPQLPQQQQQQKVEVSDSELTKFANAFQGIRMISQEAQQGMTAVVEEEGMNVQRFNEIHQASMNPEVEVEATEEELSNHKKIISELEKMQVSLQQKMEKVIQDQDLTLERYEQIAMGLQNDTELQERLKAEFQG